MGQAKKKAQQGCPVKKTAIPPHECGQKRMAEYLCPESCPMNPWSAGNYDKALEIADAVTSRRMKRFTDEERAVYGHVRETYRLDGDKPLETSLFMIRRFFVERDAQGRTFSERWRSEGRTELTNDQRMQEAFEAALYPALLEVRQIVNDREILAVDLLSGSDEPIRLVDRGLAASLCRFSTLLAIIYKTPFYFRAHSVGVPVHEVNRLWADEVLYEVIRHLGGPPPGDRNKMLQWLMEHFERVAASLEALHKERVKMQFRASDADRTETEYELRGKAGEVVREIDRWEEIECDEITPEEADRGMLAKWAWVKPSPLMEGAQEVSGHLEFYEDGRICHCAYSAVGNRRLRPLFEKRLGSRIEFRAERVSELARQVAGPGLSSRELALIPSRLLEDSGALETTLTRFPANQTTLPAENWTRLLNERIDAAFLDQPIPLLDGKTPRQAARSKKLRPALIVLMKAKVRRCDEENLRQGVQRDITFQLKELGLDELCYPPPPRSGPPPVQDGDEDEELEADDLRKPLDAEQVEQRDEILDQLPPSLMVEFMCREFPDVDAILRDFIKPYVSGPVFAKVTELAARLIALVRHPLMDVPAYLPPMEIKGMISDLLVELQDRETMEDIFNGLLEPEICFYALRQVREMPGLGEDKCVLSALTVFFIALADELHFQRG